MTDKYMLIL